MRLFTTELTAIDPLSGRLCRWCGEHIPAPSFELAQEWCQQNGKGYLTVTGELESEIPADENNNPEWAKEINYTNVQLN